MAGRLLIFLTVLLLAACLSFAGQPHYSTVVSATQANTNIPVIISTGGTLLRVQSVLLVNDGPNAVYFNFTNGVATASGASLGAGESIAITSGGGAYDVTNVGLICSAGETATVRLWAFPSD